MQARRDEEHDQQSARGCGKKSTHETFSLAGGEDDKFEFVVFAEFFEVFEIVGVCEGFFADDGGNRGPFNGGVGREVGHALLQGGQVGIGDVVEDEDVIGRIAVVDPVRGEGVGRGAEAAGGAGGRVAWAAIGRESVGESARPRNAVMARKWERERFIGGSGNVGVNLRVTV